MHYSENYKGSKQLLRVGFSSSGRGSYWTRIFREKDFSWRPIILSSSVLYELIGPVCAKVALVRSGAIKMDSTTDSTTPGEGKDQQKTEKVSEKS